MKNKIKKMAAKLFSSFNPSFEDSNWNIKSRRGSNCEPLVDYIILAEFDIDTGKEILNLI